MKAICPKCGIEFENDTNRKFCSRKCVNSRNISQETKKKISNKMKARYQEPEYRKQILNLNRKLGNHLHEEKLKRFVKAKNGQILDITYGELEEYQKTHLVCEICGKTEIASHNIIKKIYRNYVVIMIIKLLNFVDYYVVIVTES